MESNAQLAALNSALNNPKLAHLAPNEREGLVRFVEGLHVRYGDDLLRVVLFGSKARGDFNSESDLDVLVVVRMEESMYWQRWEEIVDLSFDIALSHDIVISPLIKEEASYATMLQRQWLLIRNILHDGVELWTKQPSAPTSVYA